MVSYQVEANCQNFRRERKLSDTDATVLLDLLGERELGQWAYIKYQVSNSAQIST